MANILWTVRIMLATRRRIPSRQLPHFRHHQRFYSSISQQFFLQNVLATTPLRHYPSLRTTNIRVVARFGTSRQHRAAAAGSNNERTTEGTKDHSDASTSATITTPSNTSKTSPLLILPKTHLILPSTSTSDDSSSSSSSSSFLFSHHAIDLYDPHTHTNHSFALDNNNNKNNNEADYEPPTALWTHVLLPLLSVLGRPMSTADYMRLCLTHPDYGYYTHAKTDEMTEEDEWDDPIITTPGHSSFKGDDDHTIIIGADFVTAPEVSQVFGECLGVWFAMQHSQKYAKQEWQWVECGPGKGSLMADLVRFQTVIADDFGNYCQRIHFVETSPVLRRMQQDALERLVLSDNSVTNLVFEFHQGATASDRHTQNSTAAVAAATTKTPSSPDSDNHNVISVYWHDSFADFLFWQQSQTPMVTYCLGQEFLDALPVYSFEKTTEGNWRERMVSLPSLHGDDEDDDNTRIKQDDLQPSEKKPRLVIVLAPEVTPPLRTLLDVDENGFLLDGETDKNVPAGSIIEVNPEGILLVQDMAKLLERSGGAALLIDYGQEGSADTIRAFSKHQQVGFLSRPGQVDITADVDFAALRHAVNEQTNNDGDRNESKTTPATINNSVRAFGPVKQGDFLMSMGMQERVLNAIEDEQTSDEHAENLYQAMVRLTSPEEMGERYKVLCIVAKSNNESVDNDESPPGF